jgi:hypothetical protein
MIVKHRLEQAGSNRNAARESIIRRYFTDYNNRLKAFAERMPERMLLLRTEELSELSTLREISQFPRCPCGRSPDTP